MSKEHDNKTIVGRWFAGFWGNPWNLAIINELAAPESVSVAAVDQGAGMALHAGLDLEGRMSYAIGVGQGVGEAVQPVVSRVSARHDQMGGQRDIGGA